MTVLWHAMRPWAVPILRAAFRTSRSGMKNIPKRGAAILASNHLSALDHVVLPSLTHRTIISVSKVEHFQAGPIKRFFFHGWGIIPIERGRGDNAALDAARDVLKAGRLLCIYPEGTRSRDGKLHKGHTGVARLAIEMQVPVIPVAMIGTFEAYPKGGKLKFFKPTRAVAGEPMRFPEYKGRENDRDACREVTDKVMRAIQALSGQEFVNEYQVNPQVPGHDRPEHAP